MKKVNFYQPGGIYMAYSSAAANTHLFERESEFQIAIEKIKKYLSGMLEIHAYSFSHVHWVIAFTVKDAESVVACYLRQREKSRKAKKSKEKTDPGKMVSEHFRFMNSQLSRELNRIHGRHGVLVHSRFKKFLFESVAEMQSEVSKMEIPVCYNEQKRAKYQPNVEMIEKEMLIDSDNEERSSRLSNSEDLRVRKRARVVFDCFVYVLDKLAVLRNLIINTFNTHFPHLPPLNLPKLE